MQSMYGYQIYWQGPLLDKPDLDLKTYWGVISKMSGNLPAIV